MAYVLQGSPLLPSHLFGHHFVIRQHTFANTQLRFGDKSIAQLQRAQRDF
ncbi:hypothetical protein ACNKHX_11700 [Shigella flexneri]